MTARFREYVARRVSDAEVPLASLGLRSDLALLQAAYDVYNAELGSPRPGVGGLLLRLRRGLRRLLAPILGRQVEFNLVVARLAARTIDQLEVLTREQARLAGEVDGPAGDEAGSLDAHLMGAEPVLALTGGADAAAPLAELRAAPEASLGGISTRGALDALDAPTTAAVFGEARRALRPGGVFVVASQRPHAVLAFALEAAGFSSIRLVGAHEGRTVAVATRP
jgi:hypothetical protein